MSVRVFVSTDSSALSVGADLVADAIRNEARRRGLAVGAREHLEETRRDRTIVVDEDHDAVARQVDSDVALEGRTRLARHVANGHLRVPVSELTYYALGRTLGVAVDVSWVMIALTVGCGPSTPLAITSAAVALTCGAAIEVP